MKLNDVKHNHSLTDLLKILIFSILMMIPFIDVGIRCAYVVCNKNAYQSYSNSVVENQQRVGNTATLGNGLQYQITFGRTDNTFPAQDSARIYYSNATIDWTEYGAPTGYNYDSFATYTTNNGTSYNVYLYANNVNVITFWSSQNTFNNVSFMITASQNIPLNGNETFYVNAYITKQITLDNVFDYSVNKLTTSELYTWTQQTAIYTGVQTMCTQLSINNSVIPLLLVYWFILTVIYIIIDIVLKLFTMLTHAIGSKTA